MNEAQGPSEFTMPHRLVLALRLMWVLFALGAVYVVVQIAQLLTTADVTAGMLVPAGVVNVLVLSALAFLIYKVGGGRNWARVTYIVVAVLAIVALVLTLLFMFSAPSIEWLPLAMVSALILAYGYVLIQLLHPSSRKWFQAQRGSAQ